MLIIHQELIVVKIGYIYRLFDEKLTLNSADFCPMLLYTRCFVFLSVVSVALEVGRDVTSGNLVADGKVFLVNSAVISVV